MKDGRQLVRVSLINLLILSVAIEMVHVMLRNPPDQWLHVNRENIISCSPGQLIATHASVSLDNGFISNEIQVKAAEPAHSDHQPNGSSCAHQPNASALLCNMKSSQRKFQRTCIGS